uniref:Uncharacterized protein n=1 Tax=Musa acuminata subsp. malaccensis TaxID=214687 RepID=A0A804K6V4_MUSAM
MKQCGGHECDGGRGRRKHTC